MKTIKIDSRILLSTLWIVLLFNMVIRDLHEFLREDYLEYMNSLSIPEDTVLLYGVIAQIPIFMILLSRILPTHANKWSNTVAAILSSLGLLSTLPTADMDDILFVSVGNILLLVILRIAWRLPEGEDVTSVKSQS